MNMILAEKIMNERKKLGWSQEELAEQLDVSRQSVSKWEGAQSIPDLQKIIKMAEIFGVTTDYLLKDEIEPEDIKEHLLSKTEESGCAKVRKVSMEEANAYLASIRKQSPKIANAVSACILSPGVLMLLSAFVEGDRYHISSGMACGIGVVVMMLMIAGAVFTFIVFGSKGKEFDYIKADNIETEYGVSGMVKEKMKEKEMKHTLGIAGGVICCILSVIPVVLCGAFGASSVTTVIMTCVMFAIVAAGVNILIRTGNEWSGYEALLQEGSYTKKDKKANKITEGIGGVYWCVVVAIYLGFSFLRSAWAISWIIWPVAGVFYGVINAVIKTVVNAKES